MKNVTTNTLIILSLCLVAASCKKKTPQESYSSNEILRLETNETYVNDASDEEIFICEK